MNEAVTPTRDPSVQRRLLSLAWPLILMGVLGFASNAISSYWFGEYLGATGQAVYTSGAQIAALMGLLLVAIAMGTSVTIARSVGARDGLGRTMLASALGLVVAMWLLIFVVMYIVSWPLSEYLAKSAVAPAAVREYLLWSVGLAFPAGGVSAVIVSAANGAGLTRFALSQTLIGIAATAGLLPLALGPLDQGVRAQALVATVIAVLNGAMLWYRLTRVAAASHLGTAADRSKILDLKTWWSILNVGLPAQLSRATARIVQVAVLARVAEAGADAIAGYSVAFLLIEIAGASSGGFASAVQITLGQRLGAKDADGARRTLKIALALALAFPGIAIAAYAFIGPVLVAMIAPTAAVELAGDRALQIMMFTLIPASIWQVFLQAFAAARATKRLLGVTLVAQAVAFGVANAWAGERIWGAFATIGTMYTLSVVFYALLAIPVLWRGVLAPAQPRVPSTST